MFLKRLVLCSLVIFAHVILTKAAEKNQHEEQDIYRLSDSVEPQHYELLMIPPDLSSFTFSGSVTIKIKVKYATFVIKLHSKNLKITNSELKNLNNKNTNVDVGFDTKHDLLLVTVQEKLIPGIYTLFVSFEGDLNTESVGFYRSSYSVNSKNKVFLLTHFEPNHAREAFPCFDEPRFRTPFKIQLVRYSHQTAITNTFLQTSNSFSGNRQRDTFKETPPIPTYLVAFKISEMHYVFDYDFKGRKNMIYTRKNFKEYSKYFLQQSLKLIEQTENFVGVGHNSVGLNFIATPDLKIGAMQNFAMPTFREIYVILDSQSCAEIQKTMATLTASHEIACQWFGGLVTPNWWDNMWLVHGFAGYFEYFISAKVEPTWNLEELFIFEEVQYSLQGEIEFQRKMTSSITKPSELESLYNIVTFDKAACVFRMLEHILSPNGFQCGINIYIEKGLNENQGFVTPEIFYEAFEEQTCSNPSLPSELTLTQILKTWINNIGFPLITVTKDTKTNKIKFTQTTYKSPRAAEVLPDQEWIVPITYTYKSEMQYDTKPSVWSIGSEQVESNEIIPTDDWILCNIQQSGYYRVTYDLENWDLLIKQLKIDHGKIPVINRAQLIDDSFALAYDNKLSYDVPLRLAQYLEKEFHILPWLSAVRHFDKIFVEYRETKRIEIIKNYIENLIDKLYSNFGFNIKQEDSHLFKVGYPTVLSLACKMEMKKCVEEALNLFQDNANNLDKIPADLKDVVFCTALTNAPDQEVVWNKLWSLYRNTEFAYLKVVLLSKLGCLKNELFLKKTLTKLADPQDEDIRFSDKSIVVNSFFRSSISVTIFLNFLHENTAMISKAGENEFLLVHSMMRNLESSIRNRNQLLLLESLQLRFEKLEGERYETLKKIIEVTRTNRLQTITENNIQVNRIETTLEQMQTAKKTEIPSNKISTHSSAGSLGTIFSSSWYNLIVAGCTVYYTLFLLRIK